MTSVETLSIGSPSSSGKKMGSKAPVPPSLQSIQSLPPDFRFTASPISNSIQKSDATSASNGKRISTAIPENNDLSSEVDEEGLEDIVSEMEQANDESPYTRKTISLEERPLEGDDNLDSVISPLPIYPPFRSESRWSDTSIYAANKVLLWLLFQFCIFFLPTCTHFLIQLKMKYCLI